MSGAASQTFSTPASRPPGPKAPDHASGEEGAARPATRTVLHADDSAAVRRWVADQLAGLGVKVVSVADGEAALRYLEGSACDLLLTDLEMPNLDGLELLAAVRELPARRFLPVLVLSSKQPGEFDPGRRRGVTGWLVKPVDGEHLRRWVRRVLPE